MAEYGYSRISTNKQNIERQIRNIKAAFPSAVIVEETYTGTKCQERKKLQQLLSKIRENDTIIFDSVSRMSRNAEEGFELYTTLYQKGVNLVFLKEPHINTEVYKEAAEKQFATVQTGDEATDEFIRSMTDAVTLYMFRLVEKQIKIAFEQAEKEVADLHQRTKEGIETARINGKQIGQVKGTKLTTKKSIEAKKDIVKYSKDFEGTLGDSEVMKLTGLARNTFYKYKRELREDGCQ